MFVVYLNKLGRTSLADIVLTNGNAVLQEPSNNLLVLPFSAL